jgi:hypothetical protein
MRLYNGCPDSKLKTFWDFEDAAVKRMRRLIPDARCTYFPAEGKWRVHVWGRTIGGFHDSKTTAIANAIKLQIHYQPEAKGHKEQQL